MSYQRLYAEIDLNSFASNMRLIRKLTAPGAKIAAMVKADAYGHGVIPISETAINNGADCLGVAIFEEGLELREHGINVPILVLGYTPEHLLEQVVKHDLIQTVYTYDSAAILSKAAMRLNKPVQIHIKLDTGMNRLGFLPGIAALSDISDILRLPWVNVTGFFTHFAVADEKDLSFTEYQFGLFNDFTRRLEEHGINIPARHCVNSAGLLDSRRYHLDMVRPGIIIYGLAPSDQFDMNELGFLPVMSIKAHVGMVKNIDSGVSVSYGRRYFTKRPTVAATIPAGYADGFTRHMSNGGRVLIHGKYAPVIGTVCMDQFVVDATDIPDVHAGDEVVLMGRQGGNEITADEIARIRETINYEVVCGISKRVPRIYLK